MIVTLTSKGQLTLPKAIREQMKLDAGSKLDFRVQADGTLAARPLTRKVADLAGLLHRPGMPPATLEQMSEARDRHLADKHERILRTGSSDPAAARPLKPRK
ncbi:MAG TPA: AbrB/MazE/SpoVT family DNA-binding domain-containing protein [Rubrivivax sp.]|nr:AbrB/MazE/SpoVT family DNA-binding domain-containing protein [Rubrivivax sp.]